MLELKAGIQLIPRNVRTDPTFFISALGVWWFARFARRRGLMDQPNGRSSHSVPVPRGGGAAIVLVWLMVAVWSLGGLTALSQHRVGLMLLIGALVAAVGFQDDRRCVPAKARLVAYFIAANAVLLVTGVWQGLVVQLGFTTMSLGWLTLPLLVLALVWSTNLFNFMDGIDGLAAVEALFVLGNMSWWLSQSAGHDLAVLTMALAMAVAGFLLWNWPPAKVFMGDVGSTFLGFMLGVLAVLSAHWYHVPLLCWLMVYGVFWFDATVTLVRRVAGKQVWWMAHRDHAYQRLHQAGWTHRQVLLAVIGLNISLSALGAIGFLYRRWLISAFAGAVLLLVGWYYWVERINPQVTEL